jgi:hypothetical protein
MFNISRIDGHLCVTGLSNAPDAHAARVLGYRRVLVEVLGPASVRLGSGSATVYFDRHEYGITEGLSAIEEAMPDAFCNALVRHCITPTRLNHCLLVGRGVVKCGPALLKAHHKEEAESVARQIAATAVAEFTMAARRCGHGAMLIFLPSPEAEEIRAWKGDGFLRSAHRLRPRGPVDTWNHGILGYMAWLVLFNPRAFGAKFSEAKTEGLPYLVREYVEARGMRHRTTACVIDRVFGALGVAVSQDGSSTLFRHSADGPLVHHRLRLCQRPSARAATAR